MSERDDSRETHVDPPPPVSEFTELAQLAFASRHLDAQQSLAARNLVYLSPDALDMDLLDPMQRDFGDYELLEKIGQGGMGVVYRAHQRSLDREVAIKLLIAGPWAPPKFIERFQLEAQSAAHLEHPNIVTIYEGGSQHDLHYFSMRLVRGESLSAVLRRRGKLGAREAARILLVISEAVDYAHRLGVLHLDLKPGNVLIDATGEPLVADFGLARRLDQALVDPAGDASGTPSYMAPEQAEVKTHPIGVATDIYGLGCILYEMACAQPPFSAATAQATLKRVLTEAVEPPRAHDASIPRDLEAICLRCLSKNAVDRYQSALDLIKDLRSFLDDRPVSVRRPPPIERMRRWVRREPRFAAAVAAVAGALTVGLAATFQQWQRAEDNALAARELIWESRREAALELEADGRGIEAWDRLLANLREQEQAGELDEAVLERLRIGLMRGQGARLIDTILVADANPIAAGVSPDGSLLALAFVPDLTLRWYATDGLEERGRVSFDSLLAPRGRQAAWRTSDGQPRSPQLLRFIDNDRLLVTFEWISNRVSPGAQDTWLVDLGRSAIVEPPEGLAVVAYSGNGEWALLAGADGGVELWQTTPSWAHVSTLRDSGPRRHAWMLADDGRTAFSLGSAMRGLRTHRLRDGTSSEPVSVPGSAGISAWMLSGDGRQLALGDFDGNVFVLDVASLALRRLPAQRGREITWLAFSEDDAWLAFAENDGLVQVVDVTAGDLVVGVGMRAEFVVRRVGISRRERLLLAVGEGKTALWRIPRSGIRGRPAHRIGIAPAAHSIAGRYPIAWSLDSGLLAGAGLDGQVRLWRLPSSPSLVANPARQVPDGPLRDEQRIVDVEWNQLRLVSPEGRALTEWLELERPPGFAQLVDQGRILLVTVGAMLHTYDTNALNPRHEPVPMPATPQRLLASPDGRFVLLSFGSHGDFGHEEHLRSFDAVAGRWLPGDAVLDGPIQQYALSPDEQWIAALGPAQGGVTTLIRRDGLEVSNDYTHYFEEPVVSHAFDDERLLLLTDPDEASGIAPSLVSWDPRRDDEVRRELDGGAPALVMATPRGPAVLGMEYDVLLDDDGGSRRLPRPATVPVEITPVAALSADGRILARSYRNEVQLHDAESGELIGRPLNADIRTLDVLAQLSFVSRSRELHGQSLSGVQYRWPAGAETASIAAQQSELARLLAQGAGDPPVYAPTEAERRRLRAADPGPWLRKQMRPAMPLTTDSRPGLTIPIRDPEAPPWLIDLSPAYNRSAFEVSNTFFGAIASMIRYPLGLWHLDGVDFDVRGFAQLGLIDRRADVVLQRIECLPVPAIPSAAVHLLVHNGVESPAPTGETLAELTLHYRGGTEARLPLRAGYELMGYAGDDSLVPLVFAPEYALTLAGGPSHLLSSPRLENPHPERPIRCMDLTWTGERSGSTVELFAATLEPVSEQAAVIAAEEPGSIDTTGTTTNSLPDGSR